MATVTQPAVNGALAKTIKVERCSSADCVNIYMSGYGNTLDRQRVIQLVAALQSEMGLASPIAPTPAAPKRARPHGPQAYKGNGMHKWEEVTVDAKGAGHTYRLRVPGGYLYRTVSTFNDLGSMDDGTVLAQSTVFVPMPDVVGYAV